MRTERERIETDGLVIKEQNVGESDRLITILTGRYGRIHAFVHRAKNIKSGLLSSTQLLSYSDFTLYRGKTAYTVSTAQVKTVFFGLREDILSLSTALYLAELFGELAPENAPSGELLRLLLNALYLISEKKRPPQLVKAAAELRALSMSGYMPDLVACTGCGAFETPEMVFDPAAGHLLCSACGTAPDDGLALHLGTVTAMRYIIYSEPKKIFDFKVSDRTQRELSNAAECYMREQTDHHFKTLDFLHSVEG